MRIYLVLMHNALRSRPVPRIHFHQQLEQLKDKLLAMAALSQQAVEYAVESFDQIYEATREARSRLG